MAGSWLPTRVRQLSAAVTALQGSVESGSEAWVIDVTQPPYNAVFNNATDCTTAIQAAIDAAVVPLPGGSVLNDNNARIVQLPPGVGLISAPLRMKANLVLRGHGAGATYLKFTPVGTNTADALPNTQTQCVIRLDTGAEAQCEVRDLGIIINSNVYNTAADGINFTQTGGATILGDTRHVIENIIIVNGRYALILNSGTECRVRNCGFYRQAGGLYGCTFIGGTDHFFDTVTVAQAGNGGLNHSGGLRTSTSNSRFVNCKVFGGGGAAAGINGGGQRNQWIGCEVQDYNGYGMSVGPDASVSGLVIDSCAFGLVIAQSTFPSLTKVRGAQVINRNGGLINMNWALDCPDNTNADVELNVFGSAVGTAPVRILKTGQTGNGNRLRFCNEGGHVAQATYAAAYTPDALLATTHKLATLTGNVTINNPATTLVSSTPFLHGGMELAFIIPQDATGGRVVTFGAGYKLDGGVAVPTTLSTVTRIAFEYDGTNWLETARSTTT